MNTSGLVVDVECDGHGFLKPEGTLSNQWAGIEPAPRGSGDMEGRGVIWGAELDVIVEVARYDPRTCRERCERWRQVASLLCICRSYSVSIAARSVGLLRRLHVIRIGDF